MKNFLASPAGAGILVLTLATLGGALGYAGFFWLLTQGFFALALPGGLLGIAAGFPRNHWKVLAPICGLGALALGIFAEWKASPFRADASLIYFLAHLHQVHLVSLVMIAVGAAIGFWGPYNSYFKNSHSGSRLL